MVLLKLFLIKSIGIRYQSLDKSSEKCQICDVPKVFFYVFCQIFGKSKLFYKVILKVGLKFIHQ